MLVLAGAMTMAACGGDDDEEPEPAPSPRHNTAPVADAGNSARVGPGDTVTLDGSGSTDAENETLTYSWTPDSEYEGVTLSAANVARPTFTAPGAAGGSRYIFTLTVTDGGGASGTATVTITVASSDSPVLQSVAFAPGSAPTDTFGSGGEIRLALTFSKPVLVRGAPRLKLLIGDKERYAVFEPSSRREDQQSGSATVLFVYTVQEDDSSDGGIEIPANPLSMNAQEGDAIVAADNPRAHLVETIAEDSFEVSDAVSEDVEIDGELNRAPTAGAGDDRTVDAGAVVTLDGSRSTDPDGSALDYAWQVPASFDVTLSDARVANPTFTAAEVATDGAFTFTLTVTDPGGESDTDTVTISVNARPRAAAGSDQTVTPGQPVTLVGEGSDPGDGTVGYAWRQAGGEPMLRLGETDAARLVFTAPTVVTGTTLTLELTVTDEDDLAATDEVLVMVPNQVPVVMTGGSRAVDAGAVVTLDGSRSTDPEGGALRYAWQPPAAFDVTLSNANIAKPTFTAPEVTVNTPLAFTLTVTDPGGETGTAEVTITVDAPPTAEAGDDQDVDAEELVTLEGSGSDPGSGPPVTYSWSQTAGPTASLSDATAAQPSFIAPANILGATLTFEITVADGRGQTARDRTSVVVAPGASSADHHGATVRSVSDIADNMLAVSGGEDGTVRLWNVSTASEIQFPVPGSRTAMRPLGRHAGPVYAVAISADGSRAISGGIDGTLRVWNLDSTDADGYGNEERYAVQGGASGETRSLGRKGIWIYAVALNRTGTRAVSGGFDGKVRFWNTELAGAGAGSEIFYGANADESLGSLAVVYDNGADGTAGTDDDRTHPTSVYAVALSHDGGRALSGGADGSLYLWNTDPQATGERKTALSDSENDGESDSENDGESDSENDGESDSENDGESDSENDGESDDDAAASIFAVALSGDGTLAASGGADDHVRVWNVSTQTAPRRTKKLASGGTDDTADVTSVSLNEDGSRLLSTDAKGRTIFWHPKADAGNEEIHVTRQHTDYVWSAGLSTSGLVLSGGADGTVRFYDATANLDDTVEPFATTPAELIEGHTPTSDVYSKALDVNYVTNSIALSGDGTRGLVGTIVHRLSEFFGVHLFDTTTTGEEITIPGDFGAFRDDAANRGNHGEYVALSTDASRALTVNAGNSRAYYWSPSDGTILSNPRPRVGFVAISSDGRFMMAKGSGSGTESFIYYDLVASRVLWDGDADVCDDGVFEFSLSAHARYVLSTDLECANFQRATLPSEPRTALAKGFGGLDQRKTALNADGSRALTGTSNGTMYLWDASHPESPGFAPRQQWSNRQHASGTVIVALSADGRLALSGSSGGRRLLLWDVRTDTDADRGRGVASRERLLRVLSGHGSYIRHVTLSADGRVAMTGDTSGNSNDRDPGKVRLWRIGRSNAPSPPSTITVEARASLTVSASGNVVTLDGSGSRDASGLELLSYSWGQLAGPEVTTTPVEGDPSKVTFAPVVPEDAAGETVYEFLLTVINARHHVKSSDQVITITVAPPPAPATSPAAPSATNEQ